MTFAEAFITSRLLRFSLNQTNASISGELLRLKRNFALTRYILLHTQLVKDQEEKAAGLLNEVITDIKRLADLS